MTEEAPQEASTKKTWEAYWGSSDYLYEEWDSLSEVVLATVLHEAGSLPEGAQVMEAGCGTGRISYRLARRGYQVTCLDVVESALELARRTFGEHSARYVQASILDLPRDHRYHLVWDAGVLEHFTLEEQRTALSEFLTVLEPGGKVVILTPYSHSLPYRLAKFVLEKTGRWRYGREVPIQTLAPSMPAEAVLVQEYTVSFLPFFLDSYKFLPFLRLPCRLAHRMLELVSGGRWTRWDRLVSRFLGGYLLVSVLEARP